MKVLVTGAGGFLGQHVVDRLLLRGHQVRAMVRPTAPTLAWPPSVDVVRADLRINGGPLSAFEGVEVVLHLAAATTGNEDVQFASSVVATEKFLEVMAQSSVKRFVHVSSLVVYDWDHARVVIDEETPLLRNPYGMGAYTIAKVWQERIVLEFAKSRSLGLTIMRPGFVWGREHAEIAGIGRKIGRFHFLFGPFTRLPLTHVINCADALVAALENPNAVGETFNVVDNDDIRVSRYAREYSHRSNKHCILLPAPYSGGLALAYLAQLISRTLFGKKGKLPSLLSPPRFRAQFKPVRFSNRKLRTILRWSPPLQFEDCLVQTYGTKSPR